MATRRWVGNAIPVHQVDTITFANTWATSDTCAITINGKTLTLTIGSAATVTDCALATVAMINGSDTTADLVGDETWSEAGQNVAEFRELEATSAAGVVTVTTKAAYKGTPFTMSVVETTAGSGTSVEATATAATGPNHWSDADNWSGATVPVDADTVVFDNGNVDLLYDLDPSTTFDVILKIKQSYTGKIGLPQTNSTDTSWKYAEYRTRHLTLTEDATGKTIFIGEGEGSGSGRINIDLNDKTGCQATVYNSGVSAEAGVPAVNFIGGGASNTLDVRKGTVGVGFYQGEAAHFDTLLVGYVSSVAGDSWVYCGDSVALANTAVTQTGGTLYLNSANTSGSTTVTAGVCYVGYIHANAAITVRGGTLYYNNTGTVTSLTVEDGGVVDFTRDNRSKTVSACVVYKGATIRDSAKVVTFSADIDVTGCSLDDVTLDLGSHLTVGRSAI